MTDFFISYQAFKGFHMVGIGELLVCSSCGLEDIRKEVLKYFNDNAEGNGYYEADKVIITSLTVLDPLSAAQLASDTCKAIKIENKDNSATKQ